MLQSSSTEYLFIYSFIHSFTKSLIPNLFNNVFVTRYLNWLWRQQYSLTKGKFLPNHLTSHTTKKLMFWNLKMALKTLKERDESPSSFTCYSTTVFSRFASTRMAYGKFRFHCNSDMTASIGSLFVQSLTDETWLRAKLYTCTYYSEKITDFF